MIRVGWLADNPGFVGGAEITQAEFRAAAPDIVEVVDCRPGRIDTTCDRYAIHNSLTYSLRDFAKLEDKRVVRYWNDVGMWYPVEHRAWLDENATPICASKLQADYMGLSGAILIPPAIDLEPFRRVAASVNGHRRGMVSVAQWRNWSKGQAAAARYAAEHGVGIDFYGGGAAAPSGSREVAHPGMPELLARYRTFVFLPNLIEPFGRLVAEAWAAGLELVVNDLVGAMEWIEDYPDVIDAAAGLFWDVVLG